MNTDVMAKTRLLLAQLFLKTESTYTFDINEHKALVIESTHFTIFGARVLNPLLFRSQYQTLSNHLPFVNYNLKCALIAITKSLTYAK